MLRDPCDRNAIIPTHFGFSPSLPTGDRSTAWKPYLGPLYNISGQRAGSFQGVYRPGYENDPFAVVASDDSYVLVYHEDTARAVDESGAKCTFLGAKVDRWGHHVVHAWQLQLIGTPNEQTGELADHEVLGMPVAAVVNLVHDHTGKGAVFASTTIYVGTGARTMVLGSFIQVRKTHKGAGALNVGVGSSAAWGSTIAAMCEAAVIAQVEIVDLLKLASRTPLTAESAASFRKAGMFVDSISADEKLGIGTPESFSGTLLDVAAAHHVSRRPGKDSSGKVASAKWGVWERRLECDAIHTLDKILNPRPNGFQGVYLTPLQRALPAYRGRY